MENKKIVFIAKIALLVVVGCVELSAPPAPRGRSEKPLSKPMPGVAKTAPADTTVSVNINPVIEALRLSSRSTDIGGKIKNLIDATQALKGLANTANLSESSKKDIRDLIMTNASANFHMIIGEKGGKDFNSSLKTDLNAIIATVSGWGIDVKTYARTWGIE